MVSRPLTVVMLLLMLLTMLPDVAETGQAQGETRFTRNYCSCREKGVYSIVLILLLSTVEPWNRLNVQI